MNYFLLLFRPTEVPLTKAIQIQHEDFINTLIRQKILLLSGGFVKQEPYSGGYVVRCDDLASATRLAQEDPYFLEGVAVAEVREVAAGQY